MNPFKAAIGILLVFSLISCKSMNKTAVNESSMPSDLGNKSYKILFEELNFENTVDGYTAKVHNNAAKKYFKKTFKGSGEFISESDLNSTQYADTKVYRYVLKNAVTKKLLKTHRYTDSRGTQTTTSFISSFNFVDRNTGKTYAFVGESTTPLWMFKAIIDKVNVYF